MKIDVDNNPELANSFDINVIPTLVFLDVDGKEIRRSEGYIDATGLLNFLRI